MGGKNAAKFKQSISDIMESVPDEIFTDWYSYSMSVKSHMIYLEQHGYKWYMHQAAILLWINKKCNTIIQKISMSNCCLYSILEF